MQKIFFIIGVLGPELVIRPVKSEDLNIKINESECDNCLKLRRHSIFTRQEGDGKTGAQHDDDDDDYLEVANDYR